METPRTAEGALGSSSTSEQEALLEAFFSALGHLAFDQAKEMLDKEKESHKVWTGDCWRKMVQCLSQLVLEERLFLSLAFLNPNQKLEKLWKTFSKRWSKESVKTMWEELRQELQCIRDITAPIHPSQPQQSAKSSSSSSSSSFSSSFAEASAVKVSSSSVDLSAAARLSDSDLLLSHLASQLCDFLTVRSQMVAFYQSAAELGAGKNPSSFGDLMINLSAVQPPSKASFHHPLLSPLKTLFSWEYDILNHLLQAQVLMADWRFLPTLLQLHAAHSKLQAWLTSAAVKENKKTFGSGSKLSAMPALYHWLSKFKGAMVSKFSVYFYSILSKQTTPADMKSWLTRAPEDYFGKIVHFYKKCDPFNISLVMNTESSDDFKGAGYHHPDNTTSLQGMGRFPAILSYPNDLKHHWVNVISLITSPRSTSPKFCYFFDIKAQSTYFISKVDPKISLLVIFESKKSEKDWSTNSFLTEFSAQLHSQWILGHLRPAKGVV